MKKSIILATALTAAILTVSLTACDSGKTDFNLSDYATALADSNLTPADNAVYTQSTKIGDVYALPIGFGSSELPYAVVYNTDGDSYKVRNLETGNYAADGKEYTYALGGSSPVSYSAPFIRLAYKKTVSDGELSSTTTLYDIAGPDGALLLNGVSSWNTSSSSYYTDDGETRYVYTCTYEDEDGLETVKYYTYADPEEDGIGTKLKECKEDEFVNDDVTVGESFSYIAASAEKLDEYGKALEGYTVETNDTVTGEAYTFYKDGKETGSVVLGSNDMGIGYLGDSFYYMNAEPVAASATKGYNVIVKTQYTDMKYNYTYYRYNVVKDKTTTVKTDYAFVDFDNELYNTTEEVYDRFYAYALKFESGVAVLDTMTGLYKAYYLLLGEGLEVAVDFTDKVYSPEGIVKIAEDRYLVQNATSSSTTYLLDGEENVLATYGTSMSGLAVYENSSLIVFNYNGSYMATDFDGKVVLGNKYDYALTFYGNYAITTIDGEAVIVSAANPDGKTIDEIVGNTGSEDDKYTVNSSYLSFGLITAVDSAEEKYVIFDLSGKVLLTLDNYVSGTTRVLIYSAGDYAVVCELIPGEILGAGYTYVSYYLS